MSDALDDLYKEPENNAAGMIQAEQAERLARQMREQERAQALQSGALPPVQVNVDNAVRSLFMIGLNDDKVGLDIVREFRPGFVYLNPELFVYQDGKFKDPKALKALCQTIHEFPFKPLIVCAHEGGMFQPVAPPQFSKFPSAKELGAVINTELIERIGKAIGVELTSCGIDMNLGPVLDVSRPNYFYELMERSLSSDTETVQRAGSAFIRGMMKSGIIVCPKHFPGLGGVSADPTKGPYTSDHSRLQLDIDDLPPFKDAFVECNVEATLVSNAVVTCVDTTGSACTSKEIINMMRDELGFDGVAVSDDLSLSAAVGSRRTTFGELAVYAVAAGVDVVCYYNQVADKAVEGYLAIMDALKQKKLAPRLVNDSYRRVLALKAKYEARPKEGSLAMLASFSHLRLVAEVKDGSKSKGGVINEEDRKKGKEMKLKDEAKLKRRTSVQHSGDEGCNIA